MDKNIESIKESILKEYGEHVLTPDHPDFNFDIWTLFFCRSIEYEARRKKDCDTKSNSTAPGISIIADTVKINIGDIEYEARRKKDCDTESNSIAQITVTYKERK